MAQKAYSAGGIVLNQRGDVLIVSQHGDSWSLPKGHIDPGETPPIAAAREIREESGITQLKFIKELGSYERLQIGLHGIGESKEMKHITLYLYVTDQMELQPEDPHNPEARWVPPTEVVNYLTHPKDQEFFTDKLPEIMEAI